MTTIAWDGRYLAADTQQSWGDLKCVTHKIERCGEYVYAGCGSSYEITLVRHWLSDGAKGPCAEHEFEDPHSCGIAIHEKTGIAYHVAGKKTVLVRIWEPMMSDGSGRDFALSAMHLGKSAPEAVLFATKLSVGSGGPVDTYDSKSKRITLGKRT